MTHVRVLVVKPFPTYKLFVADNFESILVKFENSPQMKVQLLNQVANIVANGKIAHHEQFCCLPQCFQKSSAAEVSEKRLYVGRGLINNCWLESIETVREASVPREK